MSQHTPQSILFNFSNLFMVCKILGIYPYNLQIFQQNRELKKSVIGTIYVIFAMVTIIILYNVLIFSYSEDDTTLSSSQSSLTFVIGIFLTYIGLLMMVTDQLAALRNQKSVGQLYDRIRIVDERLLREDCWVDNTKLRMPINIMLALVFTCELVVMLSTYIILVDHTKWVSVLWIFSCFPTLYNSLDKIWFASTLIALKERFSVINKALNDLVEEHERYKTSSSDKENFVSNDFLRQAQKGNLNFLCAELGGAAAIDFVRYKKGRNKIKPMSTMSQSVSDINDASDRRNNLTKIVHESQLNNVIGIEEKLNNFCQLHDELCDIGKTLNELWSYQILMLMAYGFLIFTAQLYFLYCATQNQDIPSLFLSAKNAFITALFLIYTAGKCIYLINLSWKTSLESKCTGICLHKCGIVVDNNDLYEIINHLSLKLLNHTVDFTACGFFSLNMETLYGVSGGITSYLIILIQFNLAAQQAKEAINNLSSNQTSDKDSVHQLGTATSFEGLISSTIKA